MAGSIDDDGALLVSGSYAGDWGWRIALAAGDSLTMRMENVVPVSAATEDFAGGPYDAMVTELRRP